jgi:hypothetical protein
VIVLAVTLTVALLMAAGIHLLWALGHFWPGHDEAALARAAVGTAGITRMPGAIPCALVTVALLFAAAWPWLGESSLRSLGLGVLALVFLGRGAAAYVPAFAALSPEEPFRTLDRRAYGPICLGLGAGFTLLLLEALT